MAKLFLIVTGLLMAGLSGASPIRPAQDAQSQKVLTGTAEKGVKLAQALRSYSYRSEERRVGKEC